MILFEEKRDVFERLEELDDKAVFFHGCNAQGAMGAGVADTVRRKWPYLVYQVYKMECDVKDDKDLMGEVIWTHGNDKLMVANGITQRFWGKKGRARVNHIESCIKEIEKKSFENYVSVRVGCGLGQLNWKDVRPLFEKSSVDWEIYYI